MAAELRPIIGAPGVTGQNARIVQMPVATKKSGSGILIVVLIFLVLIAIGVLVFFNMDTLFGGDFTGKAQAAMDDISGGDSPDIGLVDEVLEPDSNIKSGIDGLISSAMAPITSDSSEVDKENWLSWAQNADAFIFNILDSGSVEEIEELADYLMGLDISKIENLRFLALYSNHVSKDKPSKWKDFEVWVTALNPRVKLNQLGILE